MAHIREVQRKVSRQYPRGVAFEVAWRDGNRKLQATFPVRRDAERHALKVESAKDVGDTTRPLAKNTTTVAQVVEASMEAARPKLKPRTFHSYELMYANRILPAFGSRRISTVTRAEVQTWLNGLTAEGLAPATVHHHYVALRKVMKHALWDRHIPYNPCDGIDLPKAQDVDDDDLAVLTVPQVEALAVALTDRHPYDVLVRFMAYTGLRAAEVAGLRVRDVDLVAGRVSVRQTVQWVKRKDQDKGEWVFGTPKSRRSTRDLPLLDRRLIADLKRLKMQHPRSGEPNALFWPGRTPGSHRLNYERVWDLASFRRNYYKPALARTKLPAIRVHDLRHTAASLWLAAGFPPYQVSRWLGHASVVTTDTIYSHLYPTDYAEHIARFERFAADA